MMSVCKQREILSTLLSEVVTRLKCNPLYRTYLSPEIKSIVDSIETDNSFELSEETKASIEELRKKNYYNLSSKEIIEFLTKYI